MEDPFERSDLPRWLGPVGLAWMTAATLLIVLGKPWVFFLFLFATAAGLTALRSAPARRRKREEEPERETAEWIEDQAGWE